MTIWQAQVRIPDGAGTRIIETRVMAPTSHAARLMLPQTQHFKASFRQHFGHYGHHLAGANIESNNKVFDVTGHALAPLERFGAGMRLDLGNG